MKKGFLLLADGSVYQGRALGSQTIQGGEIVFHTGMTGYQEILSDPSYCGQIVMMTYPHIGNYGACPEDIESRTPFLKGFVMGEYVECYSNFRATRSLASYLEENNIPAIDQIDTREITRKIRTQGSMRAIISTDEDRIVALQKRLDDTPSMAGRNLVGEVTCEKSYSWHQDVSGNNIDTQNLPHVVVIDCGVKYNILRNLITQGFRVTVVPASTFSEGIMALQPDGVLISNGPGDPEVSYDVIANVKDLIGRLPLMGICLGHQLLSLALGGKTYKLKFGHHGANHPVKNLLTGKIEITSMNHGFAVDVASLKGIDTKYGQVEFTHVHLSDDTLEGFRIKEANLFAIQYHPESSPGPHDSHYLFEEFAACIKCSTKKS